LKTRNLFGIYAPVLERQEDGSMVLVPLNPLPDSLSIEQWGFYIGFDCPSPPALLRVESSQYLAASKFDGCSFLSSSGLALRAVDAPSYKENDFKHVEAGTPLPVFAVLNFENTAWKCWKRLQSRVKMCLRRLKN
jgi:hypothetical protein